MGEVLPAAFKSLPEMEPDTFEVIRIERSMPRFLADMDDDTIPLEAGASKIAPFRSPEGCYVGQK